MIPRPLSMVKLPPDSDTNSSSSSSSEDEDVENGSETTCESKATTGLGINFYDYKGAVKRAVVTEEKAEQVMYEVMLRKNAPTRSGTSPSLSSFSNTTPSQKSKESFSASNNSINSINSPSPVPNLDSKPASTLIEELLEVCCT